MDYPGVDWSWSVGIEIWARKLVSVQVGVFHRLGLQPSTNHSSSDSTRLTITAETTDLPCGAGAPAASLSLRLDFPNSAALSYSNPLNFSALRALMVGDS